VPKASTKDAMLKEGLRLCLSNGFAAASVRDITRAAGAPLGSFANHFPSKEAFGIEILGLYREIWRKRFERSLLNEALPPREAFTRFFDELRNNQEEFGWKAGCLLSHYSLEVSAMSDEFRDNLLEAHRERSAGFAAGLRRAVASGDASACIDCDEMGSFLDEALQGAVMKVRVERGPAPFDRFRRHVFSAILHQ
jgi:TetR/AcrR family transcriptional regulator, transcriptional repressor for nem operon